MRFDFSNPYDVATYQKLGESARRGGRLGRGSQANYLSSVMLGVRSYEGKELAGLAERPCFPPEVEDTINKLKAYRRDIESLLSALEQRSQEMEPSQEARPTLRLVPLDGDSDHLQTSADL